MPEPLKLALVTDIHNGPDSPTKKGTQALTLLRDFAAFVAEEKPDLVLELGDRISDIDRETDYDCLTQVAAVFAGMAPPRYHLLGNHDRVFLDTADNERALGQSMASTSLDLKGWRLTFWQADVRMSPSHIPALTEADLAWLKADLAATNLPAIVFTHIPLDGASMTGNYYFQANPQFAGYSNIAEAQQVISDAGNVAMCVAGHVHWNNLSRIDGIPYLSLQSLTEGFTTQGEANGGWALIEADRQLRWRGFGADPIELTVNLGGGNRHWMAPLPDFKELRRRRKTPLTDLSDVKALLIDLDGVVYHGERAEPDAVDFLNDVLASGRRIAAITNNARGTARERQAKLAALGLDLPVDHIVISSDAVARYLRETAPGVGVFVAGSPALRDAVLAAGLTESKTPEIVVAGIDDDMPLSTLNRAARYLDAGARLVASNGDRTMTTADGLEGEAGAVVAFLEAASGRTAHLCGKPDPAIFALALDRLGLSADEVAMVGDTYDTDIAGANAAGIRAIHVQSGNPPNPDSPAVPDLTVATISELRGVMGL